ncbi:hypothetical protein G6011_02778 [Alternaria panax]|uniref:Uncharacterized protein n=1 Tax=Alternaria panax TaxID=48097 RepID=A0AAD4I5L9_9PLEO|nr:hypothetical protein G6011_02778 [Alternaria panax]
MSDEQSNRDASPIVVHNSSSSALAIDNVTTNPSVATCQPDTPATPWRHGCDTQPATESYGMHSAAHQSDVPDPPQQAVYFPPPPPPPPHPSEIFAPSPFEVQDAEFSSINAIPLPELHPSTEALADEYEKLRDFGDKVVGLRFRVAAKRKELKDVRMQTSAKDGNVFNLLRKHSHADNLPFPQSILDAVDEASALRDKLGTLETEYDSTEAEYNTLEWSYTDKETRFFEKLVGCGFIANGTFKQHRTSTQHDDTFITRLTSDHLESLDNVVSSNLVQTGDPSGQLIELMGLEKELFDQERLQPQEDNLLNSVQSSANSLTEKTTERLARAQFRTTLFGKMRRVNAWLLEIIEGHPLQKVQLNARLGLNADDQSGWKLTKELLAQDNKTNVLPTSSTTVSRQPMSQDAAATSSDVLSPENVAVEHNLPTNETNRGAQSNSGRIQARLNVQSASSAINNGRGSCSSQAQSRRTSCSDGLVANTDATSHHSCSCERCTGTSVSTIEFSPPTTPTQRIQDESDPNTPHQQIDPRGRPCKEGNTNSASLLKSQDGFPPRMSKEQYLEHLILPPSEFIDELSTTPQHQSTTT